jgi:hypothetical protein
MAAVAAVAGREGLGEAAFVEVAAQPRDAGELVAGHSRAHVAGDGEEPLDVLRAEAVVTAALEDDAVAWAAAQLVDLIADAAFADGADARGALRDDQASGLEGLFGHGCGAGTCFIKPI